MPAAVIERPLSIVEKKPVHYDFIKQQLPRWLLDTGPQRLTTLRTLKPVISGLHTNALTPPLHTAMKQALDKHWSTQNTLDKKFAQLNDVQAFAEPLLKEALSAYGDIDVSHTSIRLYSPANLPWWSISVLPGVTSRTITLLDAALHNFSASETFADYAFLSDEDARGQRQLLTFTHNVSGQVLTADTFKTLCRNLDIGARYQQQLRASLGFDNPSVADALRHEVIDNLRAALDSASQMALDKNHIAEDAYELIQLMVTGTPGLLMLDAKPIEFYTLDLLDTRLAGVLIITSQTADWGTGRMLAYVPHDPEHPLKEYASSLDFVKELTRQLRDQTPTPGSPRLSYQQFFSQFVPHEQRGRFFNQLNNLLSTVRWYPREPGDSDPNWRETPVQVPDLQFRIQAVRDEVANDTSEDLWRYLHQVKLNKIINDAREIAISTDYADRMARWAWWDNLEKMLSDIFNVALMVITPFVPFLGLLMLAYTTYQLLNDILEGIVDWSAGRQIEGWEHILAVAENVIQLGTFHAGGQLAAVARLKLSPFVDRLKPVQMPSGDTRLWNPDLRPYQHRVQDLPEPQENGLHSHRGKQIVRVNNRHYEVRQDPENQAFQLAHPKRSDAYRPPVTLNGSGACVLEGEQPRAWSNTRLLRRLGPQTDGLSNAELEQVRVISGVEYGALRQMYVKNEPTPPLLADTLQRFKSDRQIKTSIEKIRMAQPLDPASSWFEQMVTELEGWPQDKALRVYQHSDLSGDSRFYGSPTAQGDNVLTLSIADVMSGQLPEKVVAFLDPQQLTRLLGETLPAPEQVQALRDRLAEHVEQQSQSLTQHLYLEQEATDDPHVQLLRTQYPDLPLSIAQRLVRHTRSRHLKVMSEDQRLPLDVKNQARELEFEVTSTRVFEQILQDYPLSEEAERLALNTLRIHTDALANLRIEIREKAPTGDLRIQVGEQDAANLRILVRNKKAQYRVFNAQGTLLHGTTDFYSAVFHTLTTDERFIDGERFRSWLITKITAPAERRLIMAEPPIRVQAEPETLTLLGGGFISTLRGTVAEEAPPATLQQRIKRWLPQMSEQGVRRFSQVAETAEGLQKLEHLETEGQTFEKTLGDYIKSKITRSKDDPPEAVIRQTRTHFADKLMEAWSEGYTRLHDELNTPRGGVRLDFSKTRWPDKLPELPTEMQRVTRLNMTGHKLSSSSANFLQHFPKLKVLDLTGNALTTLPPAIQRMPNLRELNLADNKIVLDASTSEQLSNLSRLRGLNLANNPLGIVPDISKMPNLDVLLLSDTGISEWPTGLFAQPRNSTFILELRGNPITSVPLVASNSESAVIVALTRLDRAKLTVEAQERFETYRTVAGLDPYRTYEPQGDSGYWLDDLDNENRFIYRAIWKDLEHEHGSQGFFEVIKALEPPEFFEDPTDRALYQQNSAMMRSQVQRMLSSMDADHDLRQTLFRMSSFPGLCPDAGMQIFNSMGIEVEASRARLFSRTPAEREEQLIKLAKGAANLKLLNHVARADIAHRLKPVEQGGLGLRLTSEMISGEPGTVDEVEVHLAYQTRLARRLGLPWVSEHMLYRETARVNEVSISRAHTAVLSLSEGDGLVDQILLEPYWENFLKERYATDYEINESSIDEQFALLDQLQSEQQALTQSPDLTEPQKVEKREQLKLMIEQLQIEDRVVPDEPISDELYNQLLNDLGRRRQEWLREQTRQSLGRIDE
ncbi:NEL-type E3 ubiquitin ligase domain-containing protein [Pseudomonas spelaei]|nr:NEL-type E3 ubiquitin ligase domain-containing protein [Pseudomonas spelaei]